MTLKEAIEKAVNRSKGGVCHLRRDRWLPDQILVTVVCRYDEDIEAFWSDSVYKAYHPSIADAIADDWRIFRPKKAPKKKRVR